MLQDKLDTLARMMAEHMAAPFPPGFRGRDVEGRCMVLLDADTYGSAAPVVKRPLGERERAVLTRLTSAFERVLPAIDDEYARKYYTHLRDLAVLAIEIDRSRER